MTPLRQRMIELCAAGSYVESVAGKYDLPKFADYQLHITNACRHSRFSQSMMLTEVDGPWPPRGGASISGNTCIRA